MPPRSIRAESGALVDTTTEPDALPLCVSGPGWVRGDFAQRFTCGGDGGGSITHRAALECTPNDLLEVDTSPIPAGKSEQGCDELLRNPLTEACGTPAAFVHEALVDLGGGEQP